MHGFVFVIGIFLFKTKIWIKFMTLKIVQIHKHHIKSLIISIFKQYKNVIKLLFNCFYTISWWIFVDNYFWILTKTSFYSTCALLRKTKQGPDVVAIAGGSTIGGLVVWSPTGKCIVTIWKIIHSIPKWFISLLGSEASLESNSICKHGIVLLIFTQLSRYMLRVVYFYTNK